jgi:hypothetical protein
MGLKGWLVLVVLVAAMLGLMWEVPFLLLLLTIYFVMWFLGNKKRKMHFNLLLKDRANDSICTFSRHFEFRKIDTWVIRAVYEQLQNYMVCEKANFPIRPSDDIFTDLMIDNEDFEYDIVEEIAVRTGRSLEKVESNQFYGKASIVENLVYFFNEQPKTNST